MNTSKRSPPRVIHLVSSMFIGGGQRGAIELVRELSARGLAQARICTLGPAGDFFASVGPLEVRTYDGRYNNPGVLWAAVRYLRRVLRREQPDILHTHGWDADVIGALAIKGLRIVHIAHVRSRTNWASRGGIRPAIRVLLSQWAFRAAHTLFLSVSRDAASHLCDQLHVDSRKVRVVLDGIPTGPYCSIPVRNLRERGSDCRIGAAGRLSWEKGFDVLLKAMAILRSAGSTVLLDIAGEGGLRSSLEKMSRELGIENSVSFLGSVADMLGFYSRQDLFVQASRTEGMPRVVMEAMASALPIVATDVGGTRELVRDGVDGILVPADDPERLAYALKLFLGDAEKSISMGKAGRTRVVDEFAAQRTVLRVAEIYRECTGRPVEQAAEIAHLWRDE